MGLWKRGGTVTLTPMAGALSSLEIPIKGVAREKSLPRDLAGCGALLITAMA